MIQTAAAQSNAPIPVGASYAEQAEQWRKKREDGLKREGGWLSVAGLHWLKPGANRIGSGDTNDFVLPPGSAPENVGLFILHEGKVTLKVAPGAALTVNGAPTTEAELKSDASGTPDRMKVRDLQMTIIQRGEQTGIRLWDKNAPARKSFEGLKWYQPDEAYRVTAKFVPYNPPKKVRIANILGGMEDGINPGYVTFVLHETTYRLETQSEGNGLFINFKDQTSGNTTYAPGRFLDAQKPENGQVVLDFNQAYNPPCSFTAFATCPLPPAENHLTTRIEAGEKLYHPSDSDFVPAGQKVLYGESIAAFRKADRANPPKKNQILFIGGSLFRVWNNMGAQLAPLPVLNRGFGGARTWEVLHYADQIALPYAPRVIVYYGGANDINTGETPEAILERYRQFSDRVTEHLPDTRVYFLAIFRAPQKKERWGIVDATNRLVREYSAKTKNRGFFDLNPVVAKNGKPRADLYRADGLHFTDPGYVLLAAALKPLLRDVWEVADNRSEKKSE